MLSRLNQALKVRPWSTNIAIGMAVMGVGDGFTQLQLEGKEELDRPRNLAMMLWAGFGFTCYWRCVYLFFDKYVTNKHKLAEAICRSCISIGIFGPPINSVFIASVCTAEYYMKYGRVNVEHLQREVVEKVSAKLPIIMKTSATVWGPINIITWLYIPPHIRIVWVSGLSTGWNAYLSWIQHKSDDRAVRVVEEAREVSS